MTATCFELEMLGKVAHLRLNRPDAYNSMTKEFWAELPAAVRDLDATGTCRALVISSEGKHFSAGMDLGVFGSSDALGGAGEMHTAGGETYDVGTWTGMFKHNVNAIAAALATP